MPIWKTISTGLLAVALLPFAQWAGYCAVREPGFCDMTAMAHWLADDWPYNAIFYCTAATFLALYARWLARRKADSGSKPTHG